LETDAECIKASLDGHPEQYGNLVRRYQAPLMGYLVGRLRNRQEAEEIAQEVFVRSYIGLATLKKTSAFVPWLFGIADRVVKESRRAKGRERHLPLLENVLSQPPAEPAVPDESLESSIAELDERYRQVIVLRYHGRMTCEHVAQALDLPLGTVTKRLSRAYAILRGKLNSREAQT
jgi:RNA polymerase sigma-70 factor (ECF subfamily)